MQSLVKYLLMPLLVLLLMTAGVEAKRGKGNNGNGNGAPLRLRIDLQSVGSDQDITGFADIFYREKKQGIDQRLRVKIERADRSRTYAIFVDGNMIDSITTTNGGTFEVDYSSKARGSSHPLPASIDPVKDILLVEVQDATGQIVLSGDLVPPGGGNGQDALKTITLTNTGIDTDARGKAKIQIETEDSGVEEEFEVEVENLAATTGYRLVVDGVDLLNFTTDSFGSAELEFSNQPSSGDLPLPTGLSPLTNIKIVEIRDSANQVILIGDFSASGSGGNGGSNQEVTKAITLTNTGIDTDARGTAKIKIENDDDGLEQEFEVEVEKLAANTSYKLFVDGVEVGTLNVNQQGESELEFSSNPKREQLFLPSAISSLANIKLIEVRAANGQVILTGSFN